MPIITSVEPQKILRLRSGQAPKRFNIFLDGVFAFGADEDLVVDNRLLPGKELTISDVERLLSEAEVGKLMERMYGLFNIRLRSEKEIRNYLKRLSFKRKIKDQEEISVQATELLINKLKQKGLINDKEFAKAWWESRSKKKGGRVIIQELYQKGIDKEIIEQIAGEADSNEEKTAEKLLEKKLKVWSKLPIQEFRTKAYNFLLRKGFSYSIVKGMVEAFIKKEYN